MGGCCHSQLHRCWAGTLQVLDALGSRCGFNDSEPNSAAPVYRAPIPPKTVLLGDLGLAVYDNFPVQVAKELLFKHGPHKDLTTEFWYTEEGQVVYEVPEDDSQWLYARLITKSSAYTELVWAFCAVAMKVSSLVAQTTLALECLSEGYRAEILSMLFVALFTGKLVCTLVISLRRASVRSGIDAGDLVRQAAPWDYCQRTLALAFFSNFNVPAYITDLPILAHIRKPAQPFVVFRSREGIRAWIVGWPCRGQFEVEFAGYHKTDVILNIVSDLPLVVLKILIGTGTHFSATLVVPLCLSALGVATNSQRLRELRRHRQSYWNAAWPRIHRLERQRMSSPEDVLLVTKLRIIYRDLKRHFPRHVEVPSPYQIPAPQPQAPLAGAGPGAGDQELRLLEAGNGLEACLREAEGRTREVTMRALLRAMGAAQQLRSGHMFGHNTRVVCILGSTRFHCTESEALVKAIAQQLGSALGSRVKFVIGGMGGVQETFVQYLEGGSQVVDLSYIMAGADLKERKAIVGLIGDVYITIEGGPGVSREVNDAHERGAAVVPVMRTGGASSGLFAFPRAALQKPHFATQNHWSLLSSENASVDESALAVAVLAEACLGAGAGRR